MTERAQDFMNRVWEARDNGADTEEKLVAYILRCAAETVRFYTAQNDLIVLDRNNLVELANEVENLK
jgi:hypothetical protein